MTKSLFTTLLSLLKLAGTFLSLVFKLAKSVFDPNIDVPMSIAPFRFVFVAKINRSNFYLNGHTAQGNIVSSLYYIFHINPAIE